MKICIVINTSDPEEAWNAFRFGVKSLEKGHEVNAFLINRGTECEDIESEAFDVKTQMKGFTEKKGKILACGTCLTLRKKEGTLLCPVSNMDTLLNLVESSDKIVSFG